MTLTPLTKKLQEGFLVRLAEARKRLQSEQAATLTEKFGGAGEGSAAQGLETSVPKEVVKPDDPVDPNPGQGFAVNGFERMFRERIRGEVLEWSPICLL